MNIKEITALSIEKYLLTSGWKRDYEFKNRNLMVFNNENIRIAIPSSETFDGFYDSLYGVIETISLKNKSSINDIVKDILASYYDRLEFRIVSELSKDGKLPFGYASSCIEGLKELILYSICAEEKNEPLCFRSTHYAKKMLDSFNMAQTEVGSYVINVETIVANEKNEQFTLDDCEVLAPIEHKVVQRISNAMKQIDNVTNDKEDISNIISDAYINGVTANMCDALLKLKSEDEKVTIEAKIRYATSLTKKVGAIDKICLSDKHFYYINEISKRYRENERYSDVCLRGIIQSLKINDNGGVTEKTLSIITLMDNKYRTIKLKLTDVDYIKACDAFRDQKEIEVSGTLDMSSRYWMLSSVTKFLVL